MNEAIQNWSEFNDENDVRFMINSETSWAQNFYEIVEYESIRSKILILFPRYLISLSTIIFTMGNQKKVNDLILTI